MVRSTIQRLGNRTNPPGQIITARCCARAASGQAAVAPSQGPPSSQKPTISNRGLLCVTAKTGPPCPSWVDDYASMSARPQIAAVRCGAANRRSGAAGDIGTYSRCSDRSANVRLRNHFGRTL
jgi:hypothetical protein